MRKATAFIAGFAAVLIAGAALAQIGSAPVFDVAGDQAVELTKPELVTEPTVEKSPAPIEKDRVADVVEALVECYLPARRSGERFLDTYRRVGIDPFKEAVYGTAGTKAVA